MISTEARMKTFQRSTGSRSQRQTPNKVPLIKPLFTPNSPDCTEATRHPNLPRVINLLQDPISCSLKERHISALKRVVKISQNGYFLRDLSDVFRILNICAGKWEEHPEYAPLLRDLVYICRCPFLKEKASDEMNYASVVTDSLSQMGYLMRVSNAEVQEQICSSIISLYISPDKPKHYRDGVCPTSLVYRREMIERSGLAETLLMSLAILEKQLSVKLHTLQAVQILSRSSAVNCSLILKADGAQKICFHMNEPDPSGQVLFRSTEILWNLLDNGSREEVSKQLSNMDCIMVLKEAFLHHLLTGFRQYDRQLRNDLLVITTLIAENPSAPLIESGFAKQLILFATVPELRSHSPLIRNFKLTFTNEDFEMKKLLLNLIVVLSRDLAAVQLFKESRVMLALMLLVRPGYSEIRRSGKARRSWTSIQQEELQLQALAALATVAPLMLDEYMACQANTCLLVLLDWCTQKGTDSIFGHGQGFHGSGSRSGRKAQMRYCIRLLRCMASLSNSLINQDLCDQGAISQLLGLLKRLQETTEEEDAVSIEIQTDILVTLSSLCEGDIHRKDLFGAEGVEVTVRYLKMDPAQLYSGLGHNRLVLSAVDCVWSCIVGCYTTEDLFLEKEGAFLLLDFIQSSPRSMQSVVLAALLELCDNPKTLTHVEIWRGEKELTAPVLLLQLWRMEEAEIGVKRDQHGRIADEKKPLLTMYQEQEPLESVPANRPSAAIMDVSENLRAKIYAFFCRLGFEDLPGLTAEDSITLSIVSGYLDFKVAEVWNEVTAELELEGVRPVSPDAEALSTIARSSEDKVKHVFSLQQSIVDRKEQEDLHQEKYAYEEIRLNRKQQELTAKSWEHHVAKTSSYEILKESKLLQERSIESSRPTEKPEGFIFHSTQIPGLQTTNFCGRVLAIDSTPTELTGGPLANTDLALERVPIQGGALRKVSASNSDLEFPNTVSVK
ncbi:cilia- and flagella-associated protein 69 [Ictalurus punctatus]|uniref:Cilia- and flagella-associated protein 69 n=1 Tax=Ictalurus punctatus TaxID=7998 RepID=A0A2D0SFY6_ICTPU|nr:cilia- and flagella-associated protein 69 [Ictalurus punctatus]